MLAGLHRHLRWEMQNLLRHHGLPLRSLLAHVLLKITAGLRVAVTILRNKPLMYNVIACVAAAITGLAAGIAITSGLHDLLGLLMFLPMAGFAIGIVATALPPREPLAPCIVAPTAVVLPILVQLRVLPLSERLAPALTFLAITWLLPLGLLWFIKHQAKI